jgi:hypothetical protein
MSFATLIENDSHVDHGTSCPNGIAGEGQGVDLIEFQDDAFPFKNLRIHFGSMVTT